MTQASQDNLRQAARLTADGAGRLDRIAQRNHVSEDAARTVLDALVRGGGTQAQFSHPDLGGMGQWSRGGMIMIGDMFNGALKARVDGLCTDVSELLHNPNLFERSASVDQSTASPGWPESLGQPRSSGSQNGTRYAYFPEQKRLAIEDGGEIRVYHTGNHQISGVSQQQGYGRDLAFQSQNGTVRAHDLPLIGEAPTETPQASPADDTAKTRPAKTDADDIFQTIEKLHGLMGKGILSEADFSEKKKELLARI